MINQDSYSSQPAQKNEISFKCAAKRFLAVLELEFIVAGCKILEGSGTAIGAASTIISFVCVFAPSEIYRHINPTPFSATLAVVSFYASRLARENAERATDELRALEQKYRLEKFTGRQP